MKARGRRNGLIGKFSSARTGWRRGRRRREPRSRPSIRARGGERELRSRASVSLAFGMIISNSAPLPGWAGAEDAAAMALRHRLDDVETEPAAGDLAVALGHRAVVLLEQLVGFLGGEPGALVADRQVDLPLLLPAPDRDGRAVGGVLDGVAQDVGESECQPPPVSPEGDLRRHVLGHRAVPELGLHHHRLDGPGDEVGETDRLDGQLVIRVLQPGELGEGVDHPHHHLGARRDPVDRHRRGVRHLPEHPGGEQLAVAVEDGERPAQLVHGDGERGAPGAARRGHRGDLLAEPAGDGHAQTGGDDGKVLGGVDGEREPDCVEAGLDRRLGGCGPECGEMEESLLEVRSARTPCRSRPRRRPSGAPGRRPRGPPGRRSGTGGGRGCHPQDAARARSPGAEPRSRRRVRSGRRGSRRAGRSLPRRVYTRPERTAQTVRWRFTTPAGPGSAFRAW